MTALVVAAVVIIALALPATRYLRETPPPAPPETRVDIVTPATDRPTSFALSRDGKQIVFVASADGASRLWLRSLATTTAQPLTGTGGARFPFWSPDGRAVGFFAGGALKRLDLGGSGPQTLAPALNGSGGTWSADGVIVFAPSRTTPLMRVSATGGAATALTTLGPQHQGHIGPSLLPDGRRLLFTVRGPRETAGIYLGGLDASAPTRLMPDDTTGMYLPDGARSAGALYGGGWLLWMRAGTLVAQRLDLAKMMLTGGAVTVADGLAVDPFNRSPVSVAATGLVAYRAGAGTERQLTWVDRAGNARGTVGNPDGSLIAPRVSPDGRRVAVWRVVEDNPDIWLLDGTRMSRFTFDAAADWFPIWSSDGSRVVFDSNRKGHRDLYRKSSSGAGAEELLVESSQDKLATDWSANGRFLLYQSRDPETDWDLWVLPISDDRKPWVFLKTRFNERYAQFSPDGRWVAYMSNESGQMEIYIRPFTQPGASAPVPSATTGQWQVSTAGGIFPVWRPDGKELYYLNPAGSIMAAPINGTAATPELGAPVVLFSTRIFGGGADVQQGRQYDVAPDGRFLINTVLGDVAPPITLVQNWQPDAKK